LKFRREKRNRIMRATMCSITFGSATSTASSSGTVFSVTSPSGATVPSPITPSSDAYVDTSSAIQARNAISRAQPYVIAAASRR
jgi:hypothetical protein